MIVVSDTSPINYLLLIDQIQVLQLLFEQVIIPEAVRDEMLDPDAPEILRRWITDPPFWLDIRSVSTIDPALSVLDAGEQAAITLAETLSADVLLIDERLGRQIATERGLSIVGTIGVLDEAANCGLVDLADALARLQQTNFRISRRLVQALLDRSTD
ncbi:MAG: DUF3368 domain-containing protein [Coleofasciculaceae cyanobacterium RL_1_1]|nr:DUF3368 domain-containing protein [Coleofasciculaceae cyanobacterium RL_1_1]